MKAVSNEQLGDAGRPLRETTPRQAPGWGCPVEAEHHGRVFWGTGPGHTSGIAVGKEKALHLFLLSILAGTLSIFPALLGFYLSQI